MRYGETGRINYSDSQWLFKQEFGQFSLSLSCCVVFARKSKIFIHCRCHIPLNTFMWKKMIKIFVHVCSQFPSELSVYVNEKSLWHGKATCDPLVLSLDYEVQRKIHDFKLVLNGKRQWMDSLTNPREFDAASMECYEIKDLRFNGINIVPLIGITSAYYHDSNGFGEPMQEQFSRIVGCDGYLEFQFVLPLSTWMIERFPHGSVRPTDL